MARRKNQIALSPAFSPSMTYDDAKLGAVVTMAEAIQLWGRAENTVRMRVATGALKSRQTLTGGAVLVTVASLVALWGMPKSMALFELYDGSLSDIQLDMPAKMGDDQNG